MIRFILTNAGFILSLSAFAHSPTEVIRNLTIERLSLDPDCHSLWSDSKAKRQAAASIQVIYAAPGIHLVFGYCQDFDFQRGAKAFAVLGNNGLRFVSLSFSSYSHRRGILASSILMEPAYFAHERKLTSYVQGRRRGGCGSYSTFEFHPKALSFFLVKEQVQSCGNPSFEAPEDYPTVFKAHRKKN
jgi:hypothetical protein